MPLRDTPHGPIFCKHIFNIAESAAREIRARVRTHTEMEGWTVGPVWHEWKMMRAAKFVYERYGVRVPSTECADRRHSMNNVSLVCHPMEQFYAFPTPAPFSPVHLSNDEAKQNSARARE